MAWHEPPNNPDSKESGDKNSKDPWGRQKGDNPPDLEELFKKIKKQLGLIFSDKKNKPSFNNGNRTGDSSNKFVFQKGLSIFGIVLVLLVWAISGIFIVDPAEQAVILRFGQYQETVGPGPHWIPSVIDSKIVSNVEKVSDYSYSAKMLTKDENIVSVSLAVQYRIGNLKDYLFNAADPQESLQQATASALRQVVGHSTLNEIIAEGREVWGLKVEELLKKILETYQVGILITSVSPQPARAPGEVQDAFDDAINAQEDEKRFKEQAYAYSASVVPIAEGQARRIMEEALAYQKQAILNAQGETAQFSQLLPEYLKSPNLMKERLYLEMMEKVLSNTSKIFLDNKGASNMIYLPLEQLLSKIKTGRSTSPEDQRLDNETLSVAPGMNSRGIGSSALLLESRLGAGNIERNDDRRGRE